MGEKENIKDLKANVEMRSKELECENANIRKEMEAELYLRCQELDRKKQLLEVNYAEQEILLAKNEKEVESLQALETSIEERQQELFLWQKNLEAKCNQVQETSQIALEEIQDNLHKEEKLEEEFSLRETQLNKVYSRRDSALVEKEDYMLMEMEKLRKKQLQMSSDTAAEWDEVRRAKQEVLQKADDREAQIMASIEEREQAFNENRIEIERKLRQRELELEESVADEMNIVAEKRHEVESEFEE